MHLKILRSLMLFGVLETASSATESTSLISPQMSSPITKSAGINKTSPVTRTALTSDSSVPSPAQSLLSSALPPQKPGTPLAPKTANLTTPDDGWKHGNVIINNWCPYDLYLVSVGANYLGGHRNGSAVGWGTPEDAVYRAIPSRGHYIEPYRASAGCAYKGTPPYCVGEDKFAGQAVSIKIAKSNNTADQNITQLEYALYQDPQKDDTFKRLYYDISLLDCGKPDEIITDFNATAAMYAQKLELCPGYAGGVAMTFSGDKEGAVCPPIYCDSKSKCFMIYTFDRTRRQESTFTCEKEYFGDLTLDLCAAEGDAEVQGAADRFSSWTKTATHEVLMLQLNKTAPPPLGGLATSPPVAQTGPSTPLQPLHSVTLETRISSVGIAAVPPNRKVTTSSSTAV